MTFKRRRERALDLARNKVEREQFDRRIKALEAHLRLIELVRESKWKPKQQP